MGVILPWLLLFLPSPTSKFLGHRSLFRAIEPTREHTQPSERMIPVERKYHYLLFGIYPY